MFLSYYGLREQPFGVTPDPRYLYQNAAHREVLASLIYSVESEMGFSSLIAEPGMGKTTLLYYLLKRYRDTARTAFVFETQCSSRELLQHLFAELEIDVGSHDLVTAHSRFKDFLVSQARVRRRVLVIFDEAQNLGTQVLETVRLLSNFETSQAKLMHIVLAGQPALANKLARPELGQLKQRIAVFARLQPFSVEETTAYIEHRLGVAGYAGPTLFTPEAYRLIALESRGIPREINRLCFGALSLGCAVKRKALDEEIVREVSADLQLDLSSSPAAAATADRASDRATSVAQKNAPYSAPSSTGFSWTIGKSPFASEGQAGNETTGGKPHPEGDSHSGPKPKIASLVEVAHERAASVGTEVAVGSGLQSAASAQPAREFIVVPSIRLERAGWTTQTQARAARPVTAKRQQLRSSSTRSALDRAARENAPAQVSTLVPPVPSGRIAVADPKPANRAPAESQNWLDWLGPYDIASLPMLLPVIIAILVFLVVHYREMLTSALLAGR